MEQSVFITGYSKTRSKHTSTISHHPKYRLCTSKRINPTLTNKTMEIERSCPNQTNRRNKECVRIINLESLTDEPSDTHDLTDDIIGVLGTEESSSSGDVFGGADSVDAHAFLDYLLVG